MNDRPYIVLATFSGCAEPLWFVRMANGVYRDWKRERWELRPDELMPVKADYMQYVGDWQAIAEIHNARLAKGVS